MSGIDTLRRALVLGRKLPDAVKRRRAQGPYRGYVDGLSQQGILSGWVVRRDSGEGKIAIGLFAGDALLDTAPGHILREDVRGKLQVEAQCGFQFTLSDSLVQKIAQTDGKLTLRPIADPQFVIGRVTIPTDHQNPALGGSVMDSLRIALREELAQMMVLLSECPEPERPTQPVEQAPLARHHRLFTTERLIPEIPESGQSAYLDYVRYRYRMDAVYQVEPGLEVRDRFLYWYLTAYRAQEKRRVPLSRADIDYLNEPLVMGGQAYALTRAMWWRLAGRPDFMARLNLHDRDSFLDVLFWWAHQDATHMYFEDCLVPDRYADLLRGVHPSRRLDAWPLSYFTERFFKDSAKLHFLRPGTAEGRKALALTILLSAARRPDLLRFIPHGQINTLLAPNPENPDGASDFAIFVNELAEPDTPIALSREHYVAALRTKFFDLESYSFMTRDREGNRFEAAALPAPDRARPEVDIQLIGPLAKASGLGQATRLSSEILRQTGFSIRSVDFDLDNPAPEGFSSDTVIEPYGPAKINLIHLNAESTPLAFAYQPDAFSSSYNIGYFFWELDKPAYCHYLGMDLLDEIWVSTEYGVDIYKADAQGKPVVNVGMCFEAVEDIARDEARAFVNRRFRFGADHFVCLVAFDSFSFVQRKNPVSVLKAFQRAFEGVPNARLVVKTQNRDSVFDPVQVALWDRVDAIVSKDPRIVIMNETLTYRDLLMLKAGCDCYVSLHRSEGWGFGMIEAMNLRVPVVCTAYSGNMDFCSEETAWLVNYTEVELGKDDYIFVRPGQKWAEPDVDHAAQQLRAAYSQPQLRAQKAQAAWEFAQQNFSKEAISQRYAERIGDILANISSGAVAPTRPGN